MLLLWSCLASALPAPTGSQIITPYTAIASPVVNATAALSQPIGVGGAADESGDLTLQVQTDPLDVPMDAYFALIVPRLAPGAIFLANASGGLELFASTLVPWKTNITTLNESLFGTIPLDLLPGGDYIFILLLTPAGSSNPLGGNYFVWASTLTLTPTIEEVAEAMVDPFGTGTDAPLALLLAMDKGYSLQQTVDGLLAGHFTADGNVVDGSSVAVVPEYTPLGLIIDDTAISPMARSSDRKVPKREVVIGLAEIAGRILDYGSPKREAAVILQIALLAIFEVVQATEDERAARIENVVNAVIFGWLGITETPDSKRKAAVVFYDGPSDDPDRKAIVGDCTPQVQAQPQARIKQTRGCVLRLPTDSSDGPTGLRCAENAVNAALLCNPNVSVVLQYSFPVATYRLTQFDLDREQDIAGFWFDGASFVGQVSGLGADTENVFVATFGSVQAQAQGQLKVFFNEDASAIERISVDYGIKWASGDFQGSTLEGFGNLPLVKNSSFESEYELTGAAACTFLGAVASSRGGLSQTEELLDYSCTEEAYVRLSFTNPSL